MVGGHAWEAKFGITLWIRCKKTEDELDSKVNNSPNAGSSCRSGRSLWVRMP